MAGTRSRYIRYNRSAKGRARMKRYQKAASGRARTARYEATLSRQQKKTLVKAARTLRAAELRAEGQ